MKCKISFAYVVVTIIIIVCIIAKCTLFISDHLALIIFSLFHIYVSPNLACNVHSNHVSKLKTFNTQTIILYSRYYYYYHFMDESTKAQRN